MRSRCIGQKCAVEAVEAMEEGDGETTPPAERVMAAIV